VELDDNSYDVPTSHSIDPYTGEPVTREGHHVTSRFIVVTIENQPFTSFVSDGWTHQLYYNIRIKGHYSQSWSLLYYDPSDGYIKKSDSQHTTASYLLGETSDTTLGKVTQKFPYGSQIDFQVQAMTGYCHRIQVTTETTASFPWIFTGETSGWSETQTLTITDPASTTQETPEQPDTEPEPQQPNQFVTILSEALIVIAVAASLGLAIYLIKRKQAS
jgi:hypothetical protein